MLLSIENLSVYYRADHGDVRAVDGISIDIEEGKAVAIVGESGSGKTTAALAIPRLLPKPARVMGGRVVFKGRDLLKIKDSELRQIRGKEIGMVFQEPHSYLNPLRTVGSQIAETLVAHGVASKEKARAEAREILRMVRVPDPERVYHYYPHQLSGGMAQRVSIGIAISCKPDLLIADEPTTSLDLTVQSQIFQLINRLRKELRMAVLLISHDLGVVSGVADRVTVMYAGKVAEEGPVERLFHDAKHPYSTALLDASRVTKTSAFHELTGSLPSLIDPPPGCRFASRCPRAFGSCKNDPPETSLGKEEGRVYCWLYGE